jgi:hypothetical protein
LVIIFKKMRINISLVFLIVVLVGVICFFVAKFRYQVVDANGKAVKGKFVSQDGSTASLKS